MQWRLLDPQRAPHARYSLPAFAVDDTTLATIRAEFRELVDISAASQGTLPPRTLRNLLELLCHCYTVFLLIARSRGPD